MRIIKKSVALVLCVIMILGAIGLNKTDSNAASLYIVRVGLTEHLKAQDSINISTKKIAIGYCVNNTFSEYIHFYNAKGFTFKPATGYYLVSNKVYPTYAKAIAAYNKAMKISASKKYTYLCMTGKNKWNIYVGGVNNIDTVNGFKSKLNKKLKTTFSITSYNGHRVVISGGKTNLMYDGADSGQYVQIVANVLNSKGSQTLTANGYEYRGRMEIAPYGGDKLTVVNVLNIENYLRGCVGTQMDATYPHEALRAQAVASRTYAEHVCNNTGDTNVKVPYTLNDTASSQEYGGYSKENARSVTGVTSTRGITIFGNGDQIESRYFLSSGGMTESAVNIWGLGKDYLSSVADAEDIVYGGEPWVKTLTASELSDKFKVGTVTNVSIDSMTDSGRIYALTITGDAGSITLKGENILNQLDLPSSRARIITNEDPNTKVSILSAEGVTEVDSLKSCYALSGKDSVASLDNGLKQFVAIGAGDARSYMASMGYTEGAYTFAGVGYGHGVGMSQAGAKALAKKGKTYKQILKYYYGNQVTIQ